LLELTVRTNRILLGAVKQVSVSAKLITCLEQGRVSQANKRRTCYRAPMATKQCRVVVKDVAGVEHSVTVDAESLYIAAARGVAELRKNGWVDELVTGGSIRIVARTAHETEHLLNYEEMIQWARQDGGARSPAELIRKQTVREILGLAAKSA
jgi:hypothetical protein